MRVKVLKGGSALERQKGKVAFCRSFTFSFHMLCPKSHMDRQQLSLVELGSYSTLIIVALFLSCAPSLLYLN